MTLFKLEHSKVAYHTDFALYSGAIVALAIFVALSGPPHQRFEMLAFTLTGLLSWTAVEYVLHRYVLHGLQPFKQWHEEHHKQPRALICTPTILSGSLIVILVFLPALLLGDLWRACALTLGLLTGYLGYAVTHHAIHHWRSNNRWLIERKRLHSLHHQGKTEGKKGCYGVTTAFWDRLL